MQQQFDFDKIGKREPFTVPDGFFDTLSTNIINNNTATNSRWRLTRRRAILSAAAAVAAAVTIGLFLWRQPAPEPQPCDISDVEHVFAHLSDADRAYIIDAYQNDIFITD